jgi:hypothetical protein
MVDRGEVREEGLPGGATGYRIADGESTPTANSEGETQQ